MDWTGSYMDTPGDGQEEAWTEYAAHNERLGRCGPLSACARNGHADRLPGESLEDHVWLPADQGPLMTACGHPRKRRAVTELGAALAAARKQKGWSLREAERRTGIPNAHISQIETGTIKSPELATLVPLVRAYGIQLADLLPPGTEQEARSCRGTLVIRLRRMRRLPQESLCARMRAGPGSCSPERWGTGPGDPALSGRGSTGPIPEPHARA